MKKFVAAVLALTMALALTACGSSGNQSSSSASSGADSSAAGFTLPGDVEFVVPFSAGGGSDLYSRTAANVMTEQGLLGSRAVTVNNKTGGGGSVGDAYTYTKSGDGTTITAYVSAQVTGPMINGTEVTYEDLTPICNLAMDEYTVAVLSNAEYQTLEEFIAYAKANPGAITVGGSGSGTEDELVTGLMEMYLDIDLEYIAFDSSSEVMSAMLGQHISAGIYNPNECLSQLEAGDVTVLAAFGPERISVLPEVPTFTELGYEDVQFQQFRSIFGAPNMSQEAVDFWVDVFSKVIEDPSWTEGYLAKNGLTGKFIYGDEFKTFVAGEAEKYRTVLDSLGLLAN